MSSERQIAANQANGALSQGPVTAEGKRRSSRNAEKHGIYSQSITLAGESAELYAETRAHYYARFRPADKVEEHLVDELVACHWRMTRMATLESAALDSEIDNQQPSIDDAFEAIDPATRAAFAFQALTGSTKTLEAYRRFESGLARQFDRALNRLTKLKKSNYEPNPKNEQS